MCLYFAFQSGLLTVFPIESKIGKLREYKNQPSTEEQEKELRRQLSEFSIRRLILIKQYMV